MNFIIKLLEFLYNLPAATLLRNKLREKRKQEFLKLFSQASKKLADTTSVIHDDMLKEFQKLQKNQQGLFDNQNQYLNNIAKEDRAWHVDLKHMHAHADVKHDKQLFFLTDLYKNQGFSTYSIYRDELINKFSTIVEKTTKKDFPTITRNTANIFSEVLIGHMYPGGIWKLRQDISCFEQPAPNRCSTETKQITTTESLKILIISGTFPSLMHGGGNRLFDIISKLSQKHNIDLYTHYDPELDESSLSLLKDKVKNIKLVNYPELTPELVKAWLRALNRADNYYDVVQLEYPHTIRFIHAMRQYGKKVGFTFMESLAKSFTEKLNLSLSQQEYTDISETCNKFWQAVADEKFALENADFSIAVTIEDSNFLQRLSKRKPHIIPTCISDFSIISEGERLQDSISQEENSVMFLGFFGHWPNIEATEWYLTQIHPLVKEQIPEYIFYIVGSGDTSKLQELVNGDSSVIITGRVDSVVPHILKAKLCVSPLISGAGIRGKQNQYSILNRPSVTTSIGNNGLEYIHGESVMIADSAHDFAGAIIKMLSDEILYSKIQAKAKQVASKHYTWERHITELIDIYKGQATSN